MAKKTDIKFSDTTSVVLSKLATSDGNIITSNSYIVGGYNNDIGVTGFYINTLDVDNKTITLTNQPDGTIPSSGNWITGNFLTVAENIQTAFNAGKDLSVSIHANYQYLECATITDIELDSQHFAIKVNELPLYFTKKTNGAYPYTGFSTAKATQFTNNIVYITQLESGTDNYGINKRIRVDGWVPLLDNTCVIGEGHAAPAENSLVSGYYNAAKGSNSLVAGAENEAGYCAFAAGRGNKAIGKYTTAIGRNTTAGTTAIDVAHAEGNNTQAIGEASHAEGHSTIAEGSYSHAEGACTHAKGPRSHAEGGGTDEEGTNTTYTLKPNGTTEVTIKGSTAEGRSSHAEGNHTYAYGFASHAEGEKTLARGKCSHAGGALCGADGNYSFAHGYSAHATNTGAISIGSYGNYYLTGSSSLSRDNTAEGQYSIALGRANQSKGDDAVTVGRGNTATGHRSISMGYINSANEEGTVAIGVENVAEHKYSYLIGMRLKSGLADKGQFIVGAYNKATASPFIVGNGTSMNDDDRKNLFEVTTSNGVLYNGNQMAVYTTTRDTSTPSSLPAGTLLFVIE